TQARAAAQRDLSAAQADLREAQAARVEAERMRVAAESALARAGQATTAAEAEQRRARADRERAERALAESQARLAKAQEGERVRLEQAVAHATTARHEAVERHERAERELQAVRVERRALADKLADREAALASREQALATLQRELGAAPQAAPARAGKPGKVRDLRLEADEREQRIVLEFEGQLAAEDLVLTPTLRMLRLPAAKLPRSLEKSLDTRAELGPVKRVTSFVEGAD